MSSLYKKTFPHLSNSYISYISHLMWLVAPSIPQAGPVMAVAKLWNLFGAVMTMHHQNMLRMSLIYVQLC
jgi:hypothetical protein